MRPSIRQELEQPQGHRCFARRTLELRDRTQALVAAYESGLVRPGDAA